MVLIHWNSLFPLSSPHHDYLRPLPHHWQLPWTCGPDWPSSLVAYHTSGILRGGVMTCPRIQAIGTTRGFPPETRGIRWWPPPGPLKLSSSALSRPLDRRISVLGCRQWWGTSCRSCGGSTVACVKWLQGPRSFPSLHQELACLSSGKALSLTSKKCCHIGIHVIVGV